MNKSINSQPLTTHHLLFPFTNHKQLIGRNVFDDLRPATQPSNFDAINLAMTSESEVQPASPVTLLTAAAVNCIDQPQIACLHGDSRPHAVSITGDSL